MLASRLDLPGTEPIAPFPIHDAIAALAADPPYWPASTTDLRRAGLTLCFAPAGFLSRATGGTAELHLEILDYPGERLLHLPLLGHAYRACARATPERARRGAPAPLARDWLDFLARPPADSAGDAEAAQRAHILYRSFLSACRTQEQLSLLQPGRFLNPGQIADPSLLWFCPMPFAIG